MKYVYVIERTTSVDFEGIQEVNIEVYSSMKKALERLQLCFKEDYDKCGAEEYIRVEHKNNSYSIYGWSYNYYAVIYKQEVK